ncbi:unnamed protein product [Ilex paraguariensis]|uniref:Homeobox domain-containing protein n=1 Tax=Ilex paraguariensis TaxID=185542 RepID=A0ABC8V2S9_9AQUA
MGLDGISNTGLVLGLSFSSKVETSPLKTDNPKKPCPKFTQLAKTKISFEPLLTLSLSGEPYDQVAKKTDENKVCNDQSGDLYCQDSAASSFSNVSVKREREIGGEEVEVERNISKVSDEDDGVINGRKKLRLTKAQSALLEESFKQDSALTPKQKQELAREIKLRPRQVEVWFQNRRARTKLKQTEVDCEFFKTRCETLTNENRRLQKEVQELKALKLDQPFYMQLPATTLTMCPSCERIGGGVGVSSSKSAFTMVPKPHFHNPFANPSAAC